MTRENLSYGALVSLLENDDKITYRNGLDIIMKQIPNSDVQEGQLDPRVYHVLKEQQESAVPDVFPKIHDLEDIPFKQLRNQMGWPNKDITKTDIQINKQTIKGKNGSIPIRIYSPKTKTANLPGILFFHGGAFFGGSVDIIENCCKFLSEKAEAVVIAVNYRLAPEHPFPDGINDCFDAVKWVYHNAVEIGVNHEQIVVTGDSAGGNFATVCSMKDRDLGTGIIKLQALIYPSVNMGEIQTEDFSWDIEEYTINKHYDLIQMSMMGLKDTLPLVKKAYLQNRENIRNPHISPLLAEDVSGMPETLIITAEFDKFR